MTGKSFPPEGNPSQQADYWLALSHSPLYDKTQHEAFQYWLKESPHHRTAWDQTQAFWRQTGLLTPEQISQIEQQLLHTKQTGIIKLKPSESRHWIKSGVIAFAACLALTVVFNITNWPALFADYRTNKGEQQTIILSDGSTVLLNTASSLSIDYTVDARLLTLHQGEAYFTVTPDKVRPFTVQTGQGKVTALGTAFDVKQLNDEMTVTVFQHAVRVAFKDGTPIERLNEGQRAAFSFHQIQPITAVNLSQAKAWREHRLMVKNQPLREVIEELQRYRLGKILIAGNDLARHRVTGVFDPRNSDAALKVIENTLHIKEYRLTDKLVILSMV